MGSCKEYVFLALKIYFSKPGIQEYVFKKISKQFGCEAWFEAPSRKD